LDVVVISDSEVLIQRGTGSRPAELIRDTDLTGVLGRLITALDGSLTSAGVDVEGLLAKFSGEDRAEAEELIGELTAKGILADASRTPVEQYLRFSMGAESSLEQVRVLVVGAGPLGARIGESLVRQGVGALDLLDDRATDAAWRVFVAPILCGVHAPGRPAHEVLGDQLSGGRTRVTALDGGFTAAAVTRAVKEVDLTVLALEHVHPRLAHLVNRACLREGTPWLLAQIDGAVGAAGPLFDPPHTACYNDYEVLARATSTNPAMDRLFHRYLQGHGSTSPSVDFFPGLPSYVEIVAGYAGLAAVEFLVTGSTWALERVTTIDFDSTVIDSQDLLRLPRCPVCGGGPVPLHPPFPASPPPGGAW
jgi:bacteriocin biosynthesis cyclodehydratase domain-containing protein